MEGMEHARSSGKPANAGAFVALDPRNGQVLAKYGGLPIPKVFFIDRHGKVIGQMEAEEDLPRFLQKLAATAVDKVVDPGSGDPSGSLVSIEPSTGAIRAMVGGRRASASPPRSISRSRPASPRHSRRVSRTAPTTCSPWGRGRTRAASPTICSRTSSSGSSR